MSVNVVDFFFFSFPSFYSSRLMEKLSHRQGRKSGKERIKSTKNSIVSMWMGIQWSAQVCKVSTPLQVSDHVNQKHIFFCAALIIFYKLIVFHSRWLQQLETWLLKVISQHVKFHERKAWIKNDLSFFLHFLLKEVIARTTQ